MLVLSLAAVGLAISGVPLWWNRRPRGSLGVPPVPVDFRWAGGWVAALAVMGIVFPLLGLSLVIVAIVDRLIASRLRTLEPHHRLATASSARVHQTAARPGGRR